MIIQDTTLNSPIRQVKARVELYDKSYTLVDTYYYSDKVQTITIDRVGDNSKFFGFGVSQKATVKLLDKDRNINITKENYIMISFDIGDGYETSTQFPEFYVEEITRDEKTNTLTIVGYDLIYKANTTTLNDARWVAGDYSLGQLIYGTAYYLGLEDLWLPQEWLEEFFTTPIAKDYINLEGTETIRELWDDIAEYTGTIYYIDNFYIVFKRGTIDNLEVNKANYFTLETKAEKSLFELIHTTELGYTDSVQEGLGNSTMIIRDNAFYTLDDDIYTNLYSALTANINNDTEFNLEWRGSPYLEIGDQLRITTKDNKTIYGYVFNDVIEYNGGYKHTTSWEYTEGETEEQPASVGDALKLTTAKVDKVNKEVTIAVKDIATMKSDVAQLKVDKNGITASVEAITEEVSKLAKTAITEDKVEAIIQSTPVNAVTTKTGFTFNEKGLTVEKSTSNVTTTITENGMEINQKESTVLKVNDAGVDAKNLHATTYLYIGQNSRFEDYYEATRTGCFWIGG